MEGSVNDVTDKMKEKLKSILMIMYMISIFSVVLCTLICFTSVLYECLMTQPSSLLISS